MRIAFAGTPAFSVVALDALHASGHTLAAVFTQPDRPAGRGRRLTPSPVAARAVELGLPLHKPERFDADARQLLADARVDLMVVVAYGLILPQTALDIPKHGCLNIHASLLPRWRGAAPIQRAIEAGDTETGVCIMQMEAGLDTGPVLRRAALRIGALETAASLHDRLAVLGAAEIVAALADIEAGRARAQVQSAAGVSYAHKLSKDEARIDWTQPAEVIARRVRAFNPVPVAWTELGDQRVRVHMAHAVPPTVAAAPGTVIGVEADGLLVAAADGNVLIETLQWPGGKPLPAAQVAQASGGRDIKGKVFE
jgi:methionyl-tRNA formyltransferase